MSIVNVIHIVDPFDCKVINDCYTIKVYAWLDTGKMDALIEASEFVKVFEKTQGIQMHIISEWIDKDKLMETAEHYGKSNHGQNLQKASEQRFYINVL